MQRAIKGLAGLAFAIALEAQVGIVPTVYYPVFKNLIGTVPIGTTVIPPSYMIGQFTHNLSIILNNSGGTCVSNQLVVGLDGSFDNANWTSLGTPITTLTATAGVAGQLTGATTIYGAYPFLRVNVRRAFGLNCSTNLNYVGSTTPVSFTTSIPQAGENYLDNTINNSSLATSSLLVQTAGLGSKLNLYGLSIHNEDATTANLYTVQLFNTPGSTCSIGVSGTEVDLFTFRIAGEATLNLSFGGAIPVYQAPNNNGSNADSISNFNATTGFYQLCIVATGAQLTTVTAVTRSF